MADEVARLQNDIAQLQAGIEAVKDNPTAVAAMLPRLAEKQAELTSLTGQAAAAPASNATNIHGGVSGNVLSGSFSGPVNVGPTVTGPISAGRDVNVADTQTINNTGDSYTIGGISGSTGIAIGRNARSVVTGGGDYAEGSIDKREGTFVSGDQHNSGNTFSNISGSTIDVGSTLTNVNQVIGAASHLNPQDADQLKALVAQLLAEVEKAKAQNPEAAADVAKRAEDAVKTATAEKPDKEDVEYSLGRLTKAATNIGSVIGTVLPIATQIADTIRKVVGL